MKILLNINISMLALILSFNNAVIQNLMFGIFKYALRTYFKVILDVLFFLWGAFGDTNFCFLKENPCFQLYLY